MKTTIAAIAVAAGLLGACQANPPPGDPVFTATERADATDRRVLDLVWASSDTQEREDICLGIDLLGPELAYSYFLEGAGDSAPPFRLFKSFFNERCN